MKTRTGGWNSVFFLMVVFLFSGCSAGKLMMAEHNDEKSSCAILDQELTLVQNRMVELDEADNTIRNIRDVFLGVLGFVVPPIGILNAILMVNDSYVADLAETDALETRYNQMVMAGKGKGCGMEYVLIPVDQPQPVTTDPNVMM